MIREMFGKNFLLSFRIILLSQVLFAGLNAQQHTDTLKGRNLYRPDRLKSKDTLFIPATPVQPAQITGDSLDIRAAFMRDSLLAREQFIRDSLLAREQFVKDSIQRRQRILDSLSFLKKELPVLLDAYLKTVKEDIIIKNNEIRIIGDSVLGDYNYVILTFNLTEPFTPWKVNHSLTGKSVKFHIDSTIQKITSVQTPFIKCSFTYSNKNNILVINELNAIQNDRWGQFYKTPIDSVFFDHLQRVVKIKRYIQFYRVVNNTQRGAPLFLNLSQVKQYEYGPDNQIKQYQVVNFCDRWKAYETNKVCFIMTYTFTKQNNTYLLVRHNDPPNSYADGTYTFEFDDRENLKSVSFHNLSNTENWQRIIELNKDGYVNCYVDKKKDMVTQSLCMIYHLNEPNAKYPVEKITTVYEEDGVSYFQRNNTTGLSRMRDKMTMEWGPWN
ncbi:MAG: hypothetical protein JW973_13335 [Bacteroidales bacterium]|nr:hypothetical protein [Bacteroidales bacterium]